MSGLNISKRRKARFLAVQALYQWQMNESELAEVELQFNQFNDMTKVDIDYFKQLVYDIPKHASELNAALEKYSDRLVTDMNPIDVQILSLAAYELMYCLEVPYKVAINEALDLARTFGSDESRKYINGILDSIASEHRQAEA